MGSQNHDKDPILQSVRARQGHDKSALTWGFAEHLRFTLGVDRYTATDHDRYMALAYAIRDRLINQWTTTQQTHHDEDAKRVYYLSLEFLMGRAMGNNVINLGLKDPVTQALSDLGYSWEDLREQEVDAGLGNGGLGRLAACFLDSMATLNLPSFGYGLRYDYGIFRQEIHNGYQVEQPDEWLRKGYPWEIERPDLAVTVRFGGQVDSATDRGVHSCRWHHAHDVVGVAYDTPVVGFGGQTVNTLRLWSSKSAQEFCFDDFNEGDYVEAVRSKVMAENLTKVLYPNDKLYLGKELRLRQQYFFVACSLADILRRFRKSGKPWKQFPNMAAIQLNDTHPSLAVPELMRLLIDEEGLPFDAAWEITVKTMGYTNHTLMPEALEKWPAAMLEKLLPRHLQLIYDINHEFLQKVAIRFPGDVDRLRRMSIVEEGHEKQIRMAHLSIVGSHSTNGVAALHTDLLKSRLVPDFAQFYPKRFNNKTNGITQRRWLLKANPGLSDLITEAIGDKWITQMDELKKLEPLAEDSEFRKRFQKIKYENKAAFADYMKTTEGWNLNPDTIFDVQVKRIHEYKRQLLNALHIVMIYNRLKNGIDRDLPPRTFLFGGKAAPGYEMAKLIIKFIGSLSHVINQDPDVKDLLSVHFMPNYRVSLAEKIFPASEISEQISTAGTEASGTGNMKFMCNGALTIGTLDGANIEIAEEAGRDNVYIFGLTAEEVAALRPTYNPRAYMNENEEIKAAMDLILSGHFNFAEPGIFNPLKEILLDRGDHYMHMADLKSYGDVQRQISLDYRDQDLWTRKAILNVARSGKFSSDRTIREYASDIWNVDSRTIEVNPSPEEILKDAKKQ